MRLEEAGFTRRWILEAGTLASSMVAAAPAFAKTDYDPRKSSLGQLKLQGHLDGSPAPWWYTGTIYAVRERTRPMPLFRFEGSETYWAKVKSEGDAGPIPDG